MPRDDYDSRPSSAEREQISPHPIADRPLIDHLSLRGRVAVVTGAAKGIGFAIANRLAEAGADAVLTDLDADALAQAAGVLERLHERAPHTYAVDMVDASRVSSVIEQVTKEIGVPTVLVNNAGIFGPIGLLDIDDEAWDSLMAVNLKGAFVASREVARRLVESSLSGVIVNVASTSAFKGSGNPAHYVASKHALAGLTKSMAVEFGPHGIRAITVAPTLVDTPGVRRMVNVHPDLADELQAFEQHLPLRRMATPDDVARVVAFCVSDLASYLTGAIIPIDGGELVA